MPLYAHVQSDPELIRRLGGVTCFVFHLQVWLQFYYYNLSPQFWLGCTVAKIAFIHSFIHSFCGLSYGRPIASSKRVFHTVISSAFSFNFQCPVFSLRSSSSFLRRLPRRSVTSILPSIFPTICDLETQFLRNMWPIHLAFLLFTVCRIFLSPGLFVMLLHFLHDRSN
jgi:hypothetical protein